MTERIEQGSARIYQFPVRTRTMADRDEAVAHVPAKVAVSVGGGAWYHEEAIREERRASGSLYRFPPR